MLTLTIVTALAILLWICAVGCILGSHGESGPGLFIVATLVLLVVAMAWFGAAFDSAFTNGDFL